MEYKVNHFSEGMEVFDEKGNLLFIVKRRHTWTGVLITSVYQAGIYHADALVFETRENNWFFYQRSIISYQQLPVPVAFQKRKGGYVLLLENKELAIKTRLFKDPRYHFLKNNTEVGYASLTKRGFQLPPVEYRLCFEPQEEDHLYLLFLFLYWLTPFMT
jgi:hypothetical protein